MHHDDIRIGTLANFNSGASYIRQILPHGFESFQIFNWEKLPAFDLERAAAEIREVIGDKAVISSIGMFGNPLLNEQTAKDIIRCVENAKKWFNCDIVAGFTGAIDGKPLEESLPGFKKYWTDVAKRAQDHGVKFAFEHCDMHGTWASVKWNIAHSPGAWPILFNEVPSDALALEWEPCHHMGSFADPLAILREWLPKIVHVHGKDATVAWDIIRKFGTRGPRPFVWHRHPGFGDTNWTDVISILRMAKWRGSIDIEGWHDPVYRGDMEMTGQVHSLNYLKQCRGGTFVSNPK